MKGGDARVSRLVPWIFRNEAANVAELRALGSPALLVNVENSEGRELGSAVCNLQKGGATGVNILARLVSDNIHVPIDTGFFAGRVVRALQHRETMFGVEQPYYRLLNGEGDLLPGVVCDRYGQNLCVHFSAASMELLFEEEVLDALEATVMPKAIIVRRDASHDRMLEMAPVRAPALARGRYKGPSVVTEAGGFTYEADLMEESWSSGRFFMEREQRALLRSALAARSERSASPAQVLSIFGESNGILCAASGSHTTCVVGLGGASRARLEALAQRNGCAGQVEYLEMERPQEQLLGAEKLAAFDVVTLEPPALAPTFGVLEEGERQYTAWAALAAKALKPRGLLLMVCRSRTMSPVRLLRCANLGMWSVGRRARIVHRSSGAPAPDFPVHLQLPDTCDMQVLALRAL